MAFNDSTESPFITVLRKGLAFFDQGFQAHHIIPQSLFGNPDDPTSLGSFLRTIGIGKDDTAFNRLWLPTGEDDALVLNVPIHNGSHPSYDAFVEARLQEIRDKYAIDVRSEWRWCG